MGRSQVLYNRTAARMRANRGGRGREGRGQEGGRNQSLSSQSGTWESSSSAHQQQQVKQECSTQEQTWEEDELAVRQHQQQQLLNSVEAAAEVVEQRREQQAEHLLFLSQTTSQYVSQLRSTETTKSAASATEESIHCFARKTTTLSGMESLCSRMAQALEQSGGLTRSEQMRIPAYLLETVYGRAFAPQSETSSTNPPASTPIQRPIRSAPPPPLATTVAAKLAKSNSSPPPRSSDLSLVPRPSPSSVPLMAEADGADNENNAPPFPTPDEHEDAFLLSGNDEALVPQVPSTDGSFSASVVAASSIATDRQYFWATRPEDFSLSTSNAQEQQEEYENISDETLFTSNSFSKPKHGALGHTDSPGARPSSPRTGPALSPPVSTSPRYMEPTVSSVLKQASHEIIVPHAAPPSSSESMEQWLDSILAAEEEDDE